MGLRHTARKITGQRLNSILVFVGLIMTLSGSAAAAELITEPEANASSGTARPAGPPATGADGDRRAGGPGPAFDSGRSGRVTLGGAEAVVSRTLGEGSYVLIFSVGVASGTDAAGPAEVECDLGGVTGETPATETLPAPGGGQPVVGHLTVVHTATLPRATAVTGQCSDGGGQGTQQAFSGRLVAVGVDGVSRPRG